VSLFSVIYVNALEIAVVVMVVEEEVVVALATRVLQVQPA
jgi:hypothetical protein